MTDLYYLTENSQGNVQLSVVEFDPIPIGKTSEETFYIQNQASDELSLDDITVSTDGPGEISVKEKPDYVRSEGVGEVVLEAAPISSEQLRGLKAEIEIKASAILQP